MYVFLLSNVTKLVSISSHSLPDVLLFIHCTRNFSYIKKSSMKDSFFLCTGPLLFVILPAIGLLLFTSGFFLTRVAIEDKSNTTVPFLSDYPKAEDLNFNDFARFNRVVILLIDALRYDFVKHKPVDEFASDIDVKPYHNHMKTVTHLVDSYPRHAKLYKFLADPPTTTMQRLKGLTTGSLPTFVDQTSNFNSPRITEDTILHQIASSGRNSLFAGDDTWLDLFPDSFLEAYSYPSFNVKDLHTVDDGVIKHLFPFLGRRDWTLLIGHFLGVDHCGHTYGPNHSSIKDKLIQLDSVINSVVEQLTNDSLLVIMGDHGMTETGDHGGDTSDEIHAALFLYSPNPIFPLVIPPNLEAPLISDSVSQKNIVPTLSLLLGLPIPYSNLGSIIPDLFLNEQTHLSSLSFLSRALFANSLQVWRCLKHYSILSSDIPHHEMTSFRLKIETIISLYRSSNFNEVDHLHEFIEKCTDFLQHSESLCRSIWARFRIERMSFGICLLIFVSLIQYYICINISNHKDINLTDNIFLFATISYIVLMILLISADLSFILRVFLASSCLICLPYLISRITASRSFILNSLRRSVNFLFLIPFVFSIISPLSLFSNSFVIREDSRIGYMLQTYNCILLARSVSLWYTRSKSNKSPMFPSLFGPCSLLALMMLARIFHVCRVEQLPCDSSIFSIPLLSLAEKFFITSVSRMTLSIILLIAPVVLLTRKLHIPPYSGYSLCLSSLYILIILHWLTKSFPEPAISPSLISFYYTIFPRLVYLISMYLIYLCIRNLWKPDTDFSLHYSCLSLVIWMLSCLLVGEGMVPSLALLLLYLTILSKVFSHCTSLPIFFTSHYLFLLSSKFYFSIGHQFTVQSIRYDAAFTGFYGDLSNFILAGFMIGISLFAPYICNIFFIPLFSSTTGLSEYKKVQKETSHLRSFIESSLLILSFANIQVLATCAVAFTHRRHLMVWNVFAPRFVYESIIYFVLVASITVVLCILYRVKQISIKQKY